MVTPLAVVLSLLVSICLNIHLLEHSLHQSTTPQEAQIRHQLWEPLVMLPLADPLLPLPLAF